LQVDGELNGNDVVFFVSFNRTCLPE